MVRVWKLLLAVVLCVALTDGLRRLPPSLSTLIMKNSPLWLATNSHYEDRFKEKFELAIPDDSHAFKCPELYGKWLVLGNCSQYIHCSAGEAWVRACPAGQEFNSVTEECDFPSDTHQCHFKCPVSYGEFPVYGDCYSYFRCVGGISTLEMCEPGQHWSKVRGMCSPIEEDTCPLRCPQENGTFPYIDDRAYYVSCRHGIPHLKKCRDGLVYNLVVTCQPDILEICPTELQFNVHTGRFPVLSDCRLYFECYRYGMAPDGSGPGAFKMCPHGLLYNYITEQCTRASDAVCADQCPRPDGVFGIAGMCNYYKVCTNGTAVWDICPKGTHFNPGSLQCDLPHRAGCTVQCEWGDDTKSVPGNCNQYIVCDHGVAEVYHCPENLHWNQLLGICDKPLNSNCPLTCPEEFGLFPIPAQCTDYIHCMHGYPLIKRCPSGLHFHVTRRMCTFPEEVTCGINCPKPDGIFPVEGYCSAFVKCEDNRTTIGTCEDGLHFNGITGLCDVAMNVLCMLQCPAPNGRFTLPGRPKEFFIECINNSSVIKYCSSGLRLDPMTQTCIV